MPVDPAPRPAWPAPSPSEAVALTVAAEFFFRAGSASARQLFADHGDAERLATLSDGLLACAFVCRDVLTWRDDLSQPRLGPGGGHGGR